MSATQHHWETIAHYWRHVGAPLRPVGDDARHFAELLELADGKPRRALILGVTPELHGLPWPRGSVVRAVDKSAEMIKYIWPGPATDACHGDWRTLTFPEDSFDCILCDGGLHLLDYPAAQQALPGILARLLHPKGHFVIRLFAWPEPRETPETVLADLRAGRIGNVHTFKLRLTMSLQTAPEEGIVLHRVYDRIMTEFGSLDGLQELSGWPRAEVLTLTSYRESTNRYHFLTRAASIATLETGGHLRLDRTLENQYPLGKRCPVLSFRRNA
jgi:SAM-dependent methyltransferase